MCVWGVAVQTESTAASRKALVLVKFRPGPPGLSNV